MVSSHKFNVQQIKGRVSSHVQRIILAIDSTPSKFQASELGIIFQPDMSEAYSRSDSMTKVTR